MDFPGSLIKVYWHIHCKQHYKNIFLTLHNLKNKNHQGLVFINSLLVGYSTEEHNSWACCPGSGTQVYLAYLGAGMDWRAPSWQESLDKYRCWLEKEDTESWERWEKNRLRLLRRRCCCRPRCAAAGRTLERWRSGACAARCGWGCGTVPASCAVGWTRYAAVPGQEGALVVEQRRERMKLSWGLKSN